MKSFFAGTLPILLIACSGAREDTYPSLPWDPERPPREVVEPPIDVTDGLDVDEAVTLALEKNPRYRGFRLEEDLARARKITAETYPYNPDLGVESSRATPFTKAEDFLARLSLAQTFELGGQRGYRVAAAEADVERSTFAVTDARRLLRAQVVAQFYETLYLKERERLTTETFGVAQRFLEAAEARFRAQQIPETEVNLARLDAGRARTETEQARRETRVALAKLGGLIGRPEGPALDLKGELGVIVVIPDRSKLTQAAIERRADLRSARAQTRVLEERARLAAAQAVPDLTVGLFAERESSLIDASGGTLSDRDNIVGIDLSIALPFLNLRRGERLEADLERRRAEFEVEAITQEIRRDVATAVARLETARSVVEAYERDLNALAQRSLDDTLRAYQAGEVGTLQVLRATDDLNRVRAAYAEARFALRLSLAEIEAAVGMKLSEVR